MIELPKTLRLARKGEIPYSPSVERRLEQSKNANFNEGYTLFEVDKNNPKNEHTIFTFFAEINIDNSRLWDLIVTLARELPHVAALIFNEEGDAPNYGKYIDKEELLMDLTAFKKELIWDTFIEWALIYNDKTKYINIYIRVTKYIKFWGVDKKSFKKIMEKMKLKEQPDLEFIDQYPRVREDLSSIDDSVLRSDELIQELKNRYTE